MLTSKAQDLLNQALQLDPAERAEMATQLWTSLDAESLDDLGPEWDDTLRRRLEELETGAVAPLSWEETRARILDPSRQRQAS